MPSRSKSPAPFRFTAPVIHWRGPSPFFFVAIPGEHSEAIRQLAKTASYGWGVVPVSAAIGGVSFTTSLFPRNGDYLLPLKVVVRREINLTAGDKVAVEMTVGGKSSSGLAPGQAGA